MNNVTIEVARISVTELLERLQGMGYAAEHGRGLSPNGEALVVVSEVDDTELLRAVVKEHCSHVGRFVVEPH